MHGFSANGQAVTLADTAANLLAPANASVLSLVSAVTLSADATVSAVQAAALQVLSGFTLGGHHLTIADSIGALIALDPATATMATSIVLANGGIVSAAQFSALQALLHLALNDNTLYVVDTAANLLPLVGGSTALASGILLQGNATLTADQAEALTTLPNFSALPGHIAISDTVADLLRVTGAGPLPDDWAGELIATTITLTSSATVTAALADELAALGGRLVLGGFSLTVSDAAATLVTGVHTAGLALATQVTVMGPEPGMTAAVATALAGLAHFNKGGNSVTVADTAANLASAGNAAGIALADHVQLNTAATLSVVAAEGLIGLANFQSNGAAALTIADTLPHLVQLGAVSLPHNDALLRATPIGLSENTTATVAQMAALAALPEYAHFSLNGFSDRKSVV